MLKAVAPTISEDADIESVQNILNDGLGVMEDLFLI